MEIMKRWDSEAVSVSDHPARYQHGDGLYYGEAKFGKKLLTSQSPTWW